MSDRSEQRAAIAGVLGEYCTAYDNGDAERFADLFTPDARFHGLGYDAHGRAEILAAMMPESRPAGRGTHHIVGLPDIVFAGDDNARTTTRFAVVIASGADRLFGAGTYTDALVRPADRWQIADRGVELDVALTPIDLTAADGTAADRTAGGTQ